jgi:hypothetical protein
MTSKDEVWANNLLETRSRSARNLEVMKKANDVDEWDHFMMHLEHSEYWSSDLFDTRERIKFPVGAAHRGRPAWNRSLCQMPESIVLQRIEFNPGRPRRAAPTVRAGALSLPAG